MENNEKNTQKMSDDDLPPLEDASELVEKIKLSKARKENLAAAKQSQVD